MPSCLAFRAAAAFLARARPPSCPALCLGVNSSMSDDGVVISIEVR